MEWEWRTDAHQCDQVPSADEESRNTLEMTGGRGEAWSTAQKRERPKRCRASPMPGVLQQQEALGHREGGDTSDGVRGRNAEGQEDRQQ